MVVHVELVGFISEDEKELCMSADCVGISQRGSKVIRLLRMYHDGGKSEEFGRTEHLEKASWVDESAVVLSIECLHDTSAAADVLQAKQGTGRGISIFHFPFSIFQTCE